MSEDLMTKLHKADTGHKEILISHLEEYGAQPEDYPNVVNILLGEIQRVDIRYSLLQYANELKGKRK